MKHGVAIVPIVWFLVVFGGIGGLSSNGYCLTEGPLQISTNVLQQIQALQEEKALRTPAQRKMDSAFIYALRMLRKDPLLGDVPALRSQVEIGPYGTTLVDIKATVTDGLLAEIERLGGTVISSFAQYDAIRAQMPLDQIETLAERPDIMFIRRADRAFTNKDNTSEGDVAHNAALARSTFGVNGTGVKVGVLSDSVDHLDDVQATGDLPTVTVLEDAPGNSGEGTAMLEIVHDLAPGADLYFATGVRGTASFATNIQALRDAGCDIIVDDISYFVESPFQDDIIAQAVNMVTANGALYFSSAGNSGNLNDGESGTFEGDFSGMVDPTLPFDLNTRPVHDFGGSDPTNQITQDSPYSFWLFWSDPIGASGNDYDLYLLDPTGTSIELASANFQDGDDEPWEAIDSAGVDHTGYLLVVVQYAGADRFIHLETNRGRLEHGTSGVIKGHSAAADAFAVAAVDAQAMTIPFDGTESVETFSSDGPRRIFYDQYGTPITPGDFSSTGGEVRQKPDIAAADCVETAAPAFNPFCGTSAAAPHAAAVGALLLSADPSVTPTDVRDMLTGTALDIESPGWDRDSGYGIVEAYDAISSNFGVVPDVVGLNQGDAEAAITAAGLTVGTINEEYNCTVPAGQVISQDPTAGTLAELDSAVDLVISLGPLSVPDVVGMNVVDAVLAIFGADLTIGTINEEYSCTVPVNEVISQDPVAATCVDPGTAVDLVVSLGPLAVPDVVGMSQADAEAAIIAAGLAVGNVTEEFSCTVPAGDVISQDPVAGTCVDPGTAVDLVVSLGPLEVPDVVGMSQADAETTIIAAGLTVGNVTEEYSFTVPAGDVISQDPVAGTCVNPNSLVNIVVSLGPSSKTICATLGDDPLGYRPDINIFRFQGTKGETVTIRLEADPPGSALGRTVHFAFSPLFQQRRVVTLPHEITWVLRSSGYHYVSVGAPLRKEAARIMAWQQYLGDYCITLEACPEIFQTFEPARYVE